MKVKIVFQHPPSFQIPQICSRCARNPPHGYDEVKVAKEIDWTFTGSSRLATWTFRFPYCVSCWADLKRRRLFKGKARAVKAKGVFTRKYGKFLRKRSLDYVEFEFKNPRYAELFYDANKEILFEKVFWELKDREK